MAMLEVKDLHTSFCTPAGEVKAVNGVSFNLDEGRVLGIVGESGSGKSVTAYSILQILTHPGRIVSGSIKFRGEELVGAGEGALRKIRGNKISIIFQDPMTSLNPVYTVGNQLMESILLHTGRNKEESRKHAMEMLRLVGISEPEKRMKQYPYELSGGMRQRVMIAMAMACEPELLLADEPTTALDVTIQAQILSLMGDLRREHGTAILLITHNLGVVAQLCDLVYVMYSGQIVEAAETFALFREAKHPYTQGLRKAIPALEGGQETLYTIRGTVPDLRCPPPGCRFCPRCDRATEACAQSVPPLRDVGGGHFVRCFQVT